MSGSAPKHADPRSTIEKLRTLVSHPATEEPLRAAARGRLDVLAPRRPDPPPGSPRRRASDHRAVPTGGFSRLVLAAYGTVGTSVSVPRPARCDDAGRLDLLI